MREDFIEKRDLTPDSLARALRFGVSRKSESVINDITRTLENIRTLANERAEPLPEKYYAAYKKLLRQPFLQMTPAHQNFGKSLAEMNATPETVLGLHIRCVEEVCREADEKSLPAILQASQSSLVATLVYLTKQYQRAPAAQR